MKYRIELAGAKSASSLFFTPAVRPPVRHRHMRPGGGEIEDPSGPHPTRLIALLDRLRWIEVSTASTRADLVTESVRRRCKMSEPGPMIDRVEESPAWPGVVAFIVVAGVVGGLLAWLGGEAFRDLIQPRRHPVNAKGIILQVASPRQEDLAEARNAGLAFAWQGAVLGACFGAAGGLARGDRWAALRASGFGSVAGAVGCAAMSLALLPLYSAYRRGHPDEASRDLSYPLLVHAGIWSVAGAAGGAAFGFGLGRRNAVAQAAIGGLLGATAGAAAYELIGVIAFPNAATTRFVSWTWPTRLLARFAVAILAAAGIARAITPRRHRPQRDSMTS